MLVAVHTAASLYKRLSSNGVLRPVTLARRVETQSHVTTSVHAGLNFTVSQLAADTRPRAGRRNGHVGLGKKHASRSMSSCVSATLACNLIDSLPPFFTSLFFLKVIYFLHTSIALYFFEGGLLLYTGINGVGPQYDVRPCHHVLRCHYNTSKSVFRRCQPLHQAGQGNADQESTAALCKSLRKLLSHRRRHCLVRMPRYNRRPRICYHR